MQHNVTHRQATPADLSAVLAIAYDTANKYTTNLRLSRKGMRNDIRRAISDAACLVLLDDEGGALIATAFQIGWAERKAANLLMVKADRCGSGRAMLRSFRNWCDSRMDIKTIITVLDDSIDHRVGYLFDRINIKKSGSFHSFTRS